MAANVDNLLIFMEFLFDAKIVSQNGLDEMMDFQETGDPNRRAGLGLDRYKGACGHVR